MFICNCNGINERSVTSAIQSGAGTPAQVYAAHDCRPRCGKCRPEIIELIEEHRSFTEHAPLAAE